MTSRKVLIVEDDAIIAMYIQLKLEDMGYKVVAKARNGEEAISHANEHNPELIIMDVILEGEMDGIEAVEKILETLDIPVIYLTASSDEATIKRLMKTEPHGFIIKPFDDRILQSAIHIAIQRHQAKRELYEAKEILRSTLESIDNLVLSLNENGVFTHVHSGNNHITACFNTPNILGKSVNEVFPHDVAEEMNRTIAKIKQKDILGSMEYSLNHNNLKHWFDAKFTLRKDNTGRTLGITMVLSDITQSKLTYEKLVINKEKLTEAQNIAMVGSCDILLKENRYECNDLFFQILDITDTESIDAFNDAKLLDLIHPQDRTHYMMVKQRVLENKRTNFSIRYRIFDQENKIRYIQSICKVVYDEEDEPFRMIVTIQDVSWQKLNEELRQDIQMAQKTSEIKQRFFATLCHEIRNPINGITGIIKLLEKSSLDETQRDYINTLKVSSDMLLNLVTDILDYSKIESGKMKINTTEFDLDETIKNLHIFFLNPASEKNIEVNYHIDKLVPNIIIGDQKKMIQIVTNLISNAIKNTENGKVELGVTVEESNMDNLVLKYTIHDTGAGIGAEDQQHIFKEFSQVGTGPKEQSQGWGLGLVICKQLVELLGGTIGFTSTLGKGSTFWFTLPVKTTHMKTLVKKENKKTTGQDKKLNLSILLVEDMTVNQKIMKLILEEMGCSVSIASDGKQAIAMYQEVTVNAFDIFGKIHYDIILMDQVMPVMDGTTTLHKLKSSFANLPPVIALTAEESFLHEDDFKKKGFDDCLIKPINPDALKDKLLYWSQVEKNPVVQHEDIEQLKREINNKPVINRNTIDLILKNADDNNFNIVSLLESFIEDMERIHHQSLSAVELNDYNALKLIVLTVKGLSGNLGASQVHAVARLMDRYIKDERYDQAARILPFLAEKYSVFKSNIEKEFLKEVS